MLRVGDIGMEWLIGAGAGLVLGRYWRQVARRKRVERIHLRGAQLSDPQEDTPGGPLVLGGRRFPEGMATGSRKTLLQRLLLQSTLPEIGKQRRHRALLYDAKRDLPSMLGGMGLNAPVRLLNPLDARAVAWDMAADITSPSLAQQAALLLVPETRNDNNPFFSRAARHLLSGVITSLLLRFPGKWTFRQVLLIARDPGRMERTLHAVESTRYINRYFEHEATFQNILATVADLDDIFLIEPTKARSLIAQIKRQPATISSFFCTHEFWWCLPILDIPGLSAAVGVIQLDVTSSLPLRCIRGQKSDGRRVRIWQHDAEPTVCVRVEGALRQLGVCRRREHQCDDELCRCNLDFFHNSGVCWVCMSAWIQVQRRRQRGASIATVTVSRH